MIGARFAALAALAITPGRARGAADRAADHRVEIQNLTGARLFDSFGMHRPGRAVFLKLSGEL